MPNANESYVSYLLRFRCVWRGDARIWTASVQSTATGDLRQFPDLEALLQFLRDEFAGEAGTQGSSSDTRSMEITALSEKAYPTPVSQ
jgi:hypothetical protein